MYTYIHAYTYYVFGSALYVIVVRARDFKISTCIRIYTHTCTTCSILPCIYMYLCPARDVKLEKRLDVCAQGKRASKITLSVYLARMINIRRLATPSHLHGREGVATL